MRVALHIDQLWFAAPGGIGTYVTELWSELARSSEVEVVPFASRWRHPTPPGLLGSGQIPRSEWPIRVLYPSWAIAARPSLPGELATCDVIHATNHAAVPPARDGQALVVTVHDLAFDVFPESFPPAWRWLYRAAVRAAVRRADVLVVPSQATAADLAARYRASHDKIVVTPLASGLPVAPGDPAEVIARLGIDGPFLLVPGTLEPRKNVVRTIRAYRQAAPEIGHTLVLAGPDGWGAAEIAAEIARPGQGAIVRTGRVDGGDLDALYRAADAVVYPSRYEGFGLPIVEAMQRGTPVVTSTAPACVETAGGAALLVDPDDVAALADAIVRVLAEDGLREDLRSRGLARAASFSWEATARATLDAYRQASEEVR